MELKAVIIAIIYALSISLNNAAVANIKNEIYAIKALSSNKSSKEGDDSGCHAARNGLIIAEDLVKGNLEKAEKEILNKDDAKRLFGNLDSPWRSIILQKKAKGIMFWVFKDYFSTQFKGLKGETISTDEDSDMLLDTVLKSHCLSVFDEQIYADDKPLWILDQAYQELFNITPPILIDRYYTRLAEKDYLTASRQNIIDVFKEVLSDKDCPLNKHIFNKNYHQRYIDESLHNIKLVEIILKEDNFIKCSFDFNKNDIIFRGKQLNVYMHPNERSNRLNNDDIQNIIDFEKSKNNLRGYEICVLGGLCSAAEYLEKNYNKEFVEFINKVKTSDEDNILVCILEKPLRGWYTCIMKAHEKKITYYVIDDFLTIGGVNRIDMDDINILKYAVEKCLEEKDLLVYKERIPKIDYAYYDSQDYRDYINYMKNPPIYEDYEGEPEFNEELEHDRELRELEGISLEGMSLVSIAESVSNFDSLIYMIKKLNQEENNRTQSNLIALSRDNQIKMLTMPTNSLEKNLINYQDSISNIFDKIRCPKDYFGITIDKLYGINQSISYKA